MKDEYYLFYVETVYGCGIRAHKTEEEAWEDLLRTEGTRNAKGVRFATKEDIDHISAFGGYIPRRGKIK